MINTCGKRDLGWFERIICWEVNGEEEDSALVRAVRGPHDCGLPVE